MTSRLTLDAISARLAAARGPVFWRTLEELVESEDGRALLQEEFPRHASVWPAGVSRRGFLSFVGASLALAGLGACASPPSETIVPYVRQPEEIIVGKPLFYATAMTLGGVATGLLVESHEGRPTKIEGNPQHPISRGATDLLSQASILTLYDPDRSSVITEHAEVRLYTDFVREFRAALQAQAPQQGAGVRILTETIASPTLAAQLADVVARFPRARVHQWESAGSSDAARAGALLAFGRDVALQHHFDRADVILVLDADPLACRPEHLRSIADFAARRRRVDGAAAAMPRLYVVEPGPSVTGSVADHRWPLRAADVGPFAGLVAKRLGIDVGPLPQASPAGIPPAWIDALVADLKARAGASLVIAGEGQPASVHALAHAMNQTLGAVGSTVVYTDPIEPMPIDQLGSLRELVADMAAGRVEVLLILGGNPVYTAPADFEFKKALLRVPMSAHLGLFRDETAVASRWHLSESHYLESWSDARAADGTTTIVQPLIAPLYGGHSAHELLALFTDQPFAPGYEIVRAYWRRRRSGGDFEGFWRRVLHDGVVPDSAQPPIMVSVRAGWPGAATVADRSRAGGLELVYRVDANVYDGRFANNGWLQEVPRPITKVTWDNAAMISPRTAQRLSLANEDVVDLGYRGRHLQAPVWIVPGHADDSVTLHLGYGRTLAGRVGNGVGVDAYTLRMSDALWYDGGLELAKTGRRHPIATTTTHHRMEGRHIVVTGTAEEYARDPRFVEAQLSDEPAHGGHRPPPTLYPEPPQGEYAWGMAIDLTACTGCNACVTACYAENNIPVVGKQQVARGRIMHWIRVDTWHTGPPDRPEMYHQPVPCMHCEKAPCEVVCPVGATLHSREGLNEMIYNRCVGTRYCSNNCPYKVRRFNFLQYADWRTPSLKLQRNPDVTVRSRGVMEKCTYCVQRISAARIAAEEAGRRIRDGDVITACAAACPAGAIVFGDLNDPASRVHRVKQHALDYALLGELGTRPRTTYLAAIRNPNPAIGTA